MLDKNKELINWRLLIVLLSLPVLIGALFIAGMELYKNYRYDIEYFSTEYAERYNTPGSVARALEVAMQAADTNLIAELNGIRARPKAFEPNPSLILTILIEVKEEYFHYLYFDMATFRRYPRYIKEVDNRWVHVPGDAYYYYDSGEWMKVYSPIAITYWILVCAIFLGILFFRMTRRARIRMMDSA
jgi:hypothetical protein